MNKIEQIKVLKRTRNYITYLEDLLIKHLGEVPIPIEINDNEKR